MTRAALTLVLLLVGCAPALTAHEKFCQSCWRRPLGRSAWVWSCHETFKGPVEDGGCGVAE